MLVAALPTSTANRRCKPQFNRAYDRQPMDDRGLAVAEQGATTAGAATLAIGTALVLAPERTGRLLGLDAHLRHARLIGLSDLALAPALLWARPRWPWMALRALFNLTLAGVYRSELNHAPNPRARGGFLAMCLLTVVDGTSALILRAKG